MTQHRSTVQGDVVIEADSITKRFGGAVAVDGVSVSVRAGEVHAIVGENGAGKSTLMRMLAGLLVPDAGAVLVDGAPIEVGTRAALDAGISLVHQELSLVPEMTVAENIMLGSFPTRSAMISSKEMHRFAAEGLREIGVEIDLNEPVARLSVSLRQFIEIARAVARKPRVLILDEPTATLTPAETAYLLDMLRRLAAKGLAIVYISHRLPEIFSTCDRVTVLRDGQVVDATMPIADITPQELVGKMVGRDLERDLEIRQEQVPGDVVLSARGITAPGVDGIDLDVRAGEIVGLGGLVGAGRTELVRAILGVDPRTAGEVTVTEDGRVRRIGGYQSAVRNKIAYVPEERRTEGLALTMSVTDNIVLANLGQLSRGGVFTGKQSAFAHEFAEIVGLRPLDVKRNAGDYSGGNQQKIVLAKWLARRPRVIVLDEPTRGVDVGAKAEIHRLVRELAENGTAVLMISSDLPELLDLSHIIHVIRDGRIAGTLDATEADERSVMSLAAGESMVTNP